MNDAIDDIHLRPQGLLWLPEEASALVPRRVRDGFATSSGAGLVALATHALDASLPAGLSFWRGFAHAYLSALSRQAPSERVDVVAPDNAVLNSLRISAPPVPGMEYLTAGVLETLWSEMDAYVAAESAKREGGLDVWLKECNPLWRLVGRVTFHLAENPRNSERPFAFLATYTHRLSSGADARLEYLPLGKAFQEYAKQEDAALLQRLLVPVQEAAKVSEFACKLLESKKVFHALAWTPAEAWEFIAAIPQLEEAGLVVKVPDWWQGRRPSRALVQVELDTEKKASVGINALLSFQVRMAVDGEALTPAEIERILATSDHLVSIKGKWVEVDSEKLRQIHAHWQRAQRASEEGGIPFGVGMRMLAGLQIDGGGLDALDGLPEDAGDWIECIAAGGLKEMLARLRDPAAGAEIPALKATLRPYQRTGVEWLWLMQRLGLGACLADDMGLGKTLQVIALLLKLKSDGGAPSLLVVPASLIANWRAEFEQFAPTLRVLYAHASQMDGEELRSPELSGVDAVVTTYDMVKRLDFVSKGEWDLLVLDEAQAIKNPVAGRTRAMKALRARVRIAMTGTPVENSVADLWSLFDFLNPGLLGSGPRFKDAVALMAGRGGYAPLRRVIQPYLLRRLKTDAKIAPDLPEKSEVRALCPLTKPQAILYQKSVKELARVLREGGDGGEDMARSGLVLTFLTRLKQICNHPALWTGSGNFDPQSSGKLKRLRLLSEEIAARGEKVIVFTQFREMTGPLAEFMEGCFGRGGLVLHGGTPVGQRQSLVARFQDLKGPPFFVISLKAGGTGLNLTAATHVVHFDRWWNPAVESQATDRAFRIGQQRNVLVHKFVCAGTIEEKIDRLIEEKKALADELVGDTESAGKLFTRMSNEELLETVRLDLHAALI